MVAVDWQRKAKNASAASTTSAHSRLEEKPWQRPASAFVIMDYVLLACAARTLLFNGICSVPRSFHYCLHIVGVDSLSSD